MLLRLGKQRSQGEPTREVLPQWGPPPALPYQIGELLYHQRWHSTPGFLLADAIVSVGAGEGVPAGAVIPTNDTGDFGTSPTRPSAEALDEGATDRNDGRFKSATPLQKLRIRKKHGKRTIDYFVK